jgi:hypothetical protein
LPGVGFAVLASPFDAWIMVASAVAMSGLAQGAEGDVAAYIVARRFGLPIFGLVIGLVGAATAFGASSGALILSFMLKRWDSFAPFVAFSAVVTILGALLFLLLGRWRPVSAFAEP